MSKLELRMIYYGFYKLDLFSEIKNEYLITKEYSRNMPFRIRSDQSVESAIPRQIRTEKWKTFNMKVVENL